MSKALRLTLRLLLIVLALLLVAAIAAGWQLRGSLATLDGARVMTGLSDIVSIERDALGTVTVDAGNEFDAMRALGFAHAQERYFEMDLLRRSAAGELAELFGAPALDLDKARRMHRLRARAVAMTQDLTTHQHLLLSAYVEGVNAGLAGLRARPWPYLLLRQTPAPWRIEDSALVVFAMFFDLNDSRNRRELERWQMRQGLPEALFDLLTHGGSEWDAPMLGEAYGNASVPTPEQLDLRALPAAGAHRQGADGACGDSMPPHAAMACPEGAGEEPPEIATSPPRYRLRENDQLPGSNNWAVSGALTGDGRAIVANDMHLGHRAPNIWFRARLRFDDAAAVGGRVDATGVSLPGVPALVVGSNGRVAWGFTNSYGDWLDWFEVTWVDRAAGRYRVAEGELEVQTHRERIRIAGAGPVDIEVRETRWGPIVHDLEDGGSLALAWTAHRPGGLTFGMAELLRARNLDEALDIANRSGIPPQNFVVGDAGGRIAWTVMGRIPNRVGGCDPLLPLDPLAGCDWDGWRDPSETPRIVDPGNHRLWSANARVADGQALAIIGDSGYDLGARARQIRDGLLARERFTEADLLAIQLDDRAVFLERWWKLLRQTLATAADPALTDFEAATRDWEGRASGDSVSYRLTRAFRNQVAKTVGDAYLALIDDDPVNGHVNGRDAALAELFGDRRLNQFEGALWPLMEQRPAHLLPPGQESWEAMLLAAVRSVADELRGQAGGLAARTWGERNSAAICHPLATALPGPFRRLLCMPADPLPGDSNMPRVQGRSFGASERMVVSPGHEADGYFHMPGGQSGHPLSPFWGAGHVDWVQGKPTPFLPGEAAHRLTLRPR